MPDYRLHVFKPMVSMTHVWALVDLIPIVASDDDEAFAHACKTRPEGFTAEDRAILFKDNYSKHWTVRADRT